MNIEQHGANKFIDLAQDVLNNFDFQKVRKCMIALDWNWTFGVKYNEEQMGIPSLRTLQARAYDLLEQAYKEKLQVGSGGFSAGYIDGILFLTFSVEESKAYDYDLLSEE